MDNIIIGAYCNAFYKKRILFNSIESLHKDFEVWLSSHLPVDSLIQSLTRFFVYEKENLIYKKESIFWFANESFYFQEKKERDVYSLAFLSQFWNIVPILKMYGIKDFFFVDGDCVFNKEGVKKLKSLKKECELNNKKASIFYSSDNHHHVTMMYFHVDLFEEIFPNLTSIESFQSFIEENGQDEIVEGLFYNRVKKLNLENKINFIKTHPCLYLGEGVQFNLSKVSDDQEIEGKPDYVWFVTRSINDEGVYFLFINNSTNPVKQKIKVRWNGQPFIEFDNANFSLWQQIPKTEINEFEIEVNGQLKTYNYNKVLMDQGVYLKFN